MSANNFSGRLYIYRIQCAYISSFKQKIHLHFNRTTGILNKTRFINVPPPEKLQQLISGSSMKIFTLLDKISFAPPEKKTKQRVPLRTNFFTFVELLLILAIIGIITGLLLPQFLRSSNVGRFARWLKYNESLNQKPETVVNFNFQEYGYKLNIDGVMTPCVENLASACSVKGFEAKKYAGIMINNPEWLPHGGRWYEKGAMQFNGANQCLYVPEGLALNFLMSKNDFTIYFWIYYYSKPSGALFAKGKGSGKLEYAMFLCDSKPQVIIGKKELHCERKITEKSWHHIAVVNKAGSGVEIFVDGDIQEAKDIKSKLGLDFKSSKYLTIGALSREKVKTIVNSRTGKTEKENYYSLTSCFRGKIDEIVILRRAMSSKGVKNVYETGRAAQH